MVLNQKCNPEYYEAAWPTILKPTEFMVIHMLGVHNDFAGQGLAKEMVRFAIATAKSAGMKAIRLDVLEGNTAAERLYEGCGFRRMTSLPMYYEDTGWANFILYELVL